METKHRGDYASGVFRAYWWLLLVLTAAVAAAQPRFSPDDTLSVRFRAAAAVRSGDQHDLGPGLSYSGHTWNDLALSAWWYFALESKLGVTFELQREGFSLNEMNSPVLSGGLARFHLGPTARVRFGPVRLEGFIGYAFHQLPYFGETAAPSFLGAARHALALGGRVLVDLGPVTIDVRGNFPISLGVAFPAPAMLSQASSLGGLVGAGVRVQLFRTGSLHWGLMAEVTWTPDGITAQNFNAKQSVVRPGFAIDLQWRSALPAETPKQDDAITLALSCVGPDNRPLPNVALALTQGETSVRTACDAAGRAQVEGLKAGPATVEASLEGYQPSTTEVTVSREATSATLIQLRQPPKGTLRIAVEDKQTKAAVSAALITVNGEPMRGAELTLPTGVYPIKVTAPDYNPVEEVASIADGKVTALTIEMTAVSKRIPATLTINVRNALTGAKVKALVELLELKQQANADAKATLTVLGGAYTLRVSAPGFVTQSKSVTVRDGDQAIYNIDMSPR